ncbi:MAG: beta-galactosidase [Uliginosibacterium sp.]|nr:beta-galactosidase [Uliginosibacterium sp.]
MGVIHGGTNFGFTAGANADPAGNTYQPQVTSYDYGAPISEHGRATPLYTAYRNTLARYLGGLDALPPVPADMPSLRRAADFTLQPIRHSSLWEDAPVAIPAAQPKTFESIGLNGGLLRYRCSLPTDPRGGALPTRNDARSRPATSCARVAGPLLNLRATQLPDIAPRRATTPYRQNSERKASGQGVLQSGSRRRLATPDACLRHAAPPPPNRGSGIAAPFKVSFHPRQHGDVALSAWGKKEWLVERIMR